MIKRICLPIFLLCSVFVKVKAAEVILSEQPIEMRLPVNKEMIIKFPEAVTHTNTLNPDAAKNFASLLTPDGVLYLTANKPFDKTRMIAELVDGRLVMLDLFAAAEGPYENLTIINKPKQSPKPVNKPQKTEEPPPQNPYKPDFLRDGTAKTRSGTTGGNESGAYYRMVQFGFRHFVGPQRLIGESMGKQIYQGKKTVNGMLRLYGDRLRVQKLAEWQIHDRYLTVLLVNNLSHTVIEFDPRAIRGRWMFAAALYPVLEPRGRQFDQTLWALISAVPFEQARRIP